MALKITIYNDTGGGLDCDFEVIEVVDGKEVGRQTCVSGEQPPGNSFELAMPNQCFIVVPKGVAWPLQVVTQTVIGYRRRTVPARKKKAFKT